MAWGGASREEFHRIVFSGWGLLFGVLLLLNPLLIAGFAALDDQPTAPSDLHRGAQFTHGSLGVATFGMVGTSLVPFAIIGAVVLAPARSGATLGRLAAFGALTLVAWTVPVLVLGGITVGASIVVPALIGTLMLGLELAAWVGIASYATTFRRIHPLLVGTGIFVALAILSSFAGFLPYVVPAYREMGFEEVRLVTQRFAWVTPADTGRAFANAMFPGNAGFYDPTAIEYADQRILFSPWTWGAAAVAWAAMPTLLAMRRERAWPDDADPA